MGPWSRNAVTPLVVMTRLILCWVLLVASRQARRPQDLPVVSGVSIVRTPNKTYMYLDCCEMGQAGIAAKLVSYKHEHVNGEQSVGETWAERSLCIEAALRVHRWQSASYIHRSASSVAADVQHVRVHAWHAVSRKHILF